jgi:peptidoglycan/LPS O-acetylase OafA/YrhL
MLHEQISVGTALPDRTPHEHVQISAGARIPELDGARGIAALAVVIAHYFGEVENALYGLSFGWMGVTLFFVLSGFLIGSIILERKDSTNFFPVFYIRRALRICPIYFLVLAVTLGFIWLHGPSSWIEPPLFAASYFTFTQNFVMAWGGGVGTLWLLPTWTVAVEEQFYLVVPLLIIWLPNRFLLPAILTGIAVCLLTRIVLYSTGAIPPSKYLLFSNGHFLLFGVLAAYVHRCIKVPEIVLRLIPLLFIVALDVVLFAKGNSLHPAFLTLIAPLFACYIILAAQNWSKLKFLRLRILRAFGTISYCLYLVHQPVNGVLHGLILDGRPDIGTVPQALVTCAALITSISIAALSWVLLERPLLRLGKHKSWESTDMRVS